MNLLAVNSSPSRPSRTRAIAELAVELEGGRLLDVGDIGPDSLLQRRSHPSLEEARAAVAAADAVLFATPVYRATYSGILKTFLDLLPQDGLAGKTCVLAATGRIAGHLLSLDAGLRVAVASVRGWTVPTVVYAVPEDFDDQGRPLDRVRTTLVEALAEARLLVNARAPGH